MDRLRRFPCLTRETPAAQGATWRNNPSASASAQQAYDPWLQPELFRGVLTKRVFAFVIDLVILSIPIVLAIIFIALFGIVTLGLGWFLFWLISPLSVIWALIYYGTSLGGPHGATVGMRMMDIEMRTWTGEQPLFRSRRGPRHSLLGVGIVPDAAGAVGWPVQRPPQVAARHRARHGLHQQQRPCTGCTDQPRLNTAAASGG